jgi:hypothetical protein
MTYRAPQDDRIPDRPGDGDAIGVYDKPTRAQARAGMTPLILLVAVIAVLVILALLFLL